MPGAAQATCAPMGALRGGERAEHPRGRARRDMRGNLTAPGAARHDGLLEPKRVEDLQHRVGVCIGLHIAPRGVAPAESGTIEPQRTPSGPKGPHDLHI